MSEGLAQGPFVAARVGFEPETLRTEDTELTTEPPGLTIMLTYLPTKTKRSAQLDSKISAFFSE